jgi:hypothetical protein
MGEILGKSDMSDEEDREHPGLARVKAMWEKGDFEKLDKMVRYWEAIENLGMLGDLLRRVILWLGVVAGAYIVASGYLADWVRGIR